MPAAERPAMISTITRQQALAWLKPEIRLAAARVRDAVEAHQEQDAESPTIKAALQEVMHIEGALDMGGLHGPAMLARHIRSNLQDVLLDNAESNGEALANIGSAVLWLSAWVDGTQPATPESAAVAHPVLVSMYAASKKSVPSEADLFVDQMTHGGFRVHPPALPVRAAGTSSVVARKLLLPFQTLLLQWLKGQDTSRLVDKLRKVSDQVANNAIEPSVLTLWLCCSAALESLSQGAAAESIELKRCLGRMGRHLKQLSEYGEAASAEAIETAWRLLAYSAPLGTRGEAWQQLFEGLPLATLLPLASNLATQRARLQKPDSTLRAQVGREAARELSRIKDGIDLAVRSGALQGNGLSFVREQLGAVASTLQMLQMQNEAQRLRSLAASPLLSAESIDAAQPLLLPLAEMLLGVEFALQNLVAEEGGQGSNSGVPHPVLLRSARSALVSELMINLSRVKVALDSIMVDREIASIDDPMLMLEQIGSALKMAGFSGVATSVRKLARTLRQYGEHALRDNPDQADVFAEAVSLLDVLIADLSRGVNETRLAQLQACIERLQAQGVGAHGAPLVELSSVSLDALSGSTSSQAAGDDPEIRAIFVEEAREVFGSLAAVLPKLKRDATALESLATARGGFHNLKGSGRMVGASDIGELSWALEHLLNRCLDRALPLTSAVISLVGDALDLLPALLIEFEQSVAASTSQVAAVIARAEHLASGQSPEMIEADVLAIFREDSLGRIELLKQWQQMGTPRAQGLEAMRSLHTLRGSAAAVNAHSFSALAGAVESLLDAARASSEPLPDPVSLLLHDVLPAMAEAVAGAGSSHQLDLKPWLERIQSLREKLTHAVVEDPIATRERFATQALTALQSYELTLRAVSAQTMGPEAAQNVVDEARQLAGLAQQQNGTQLAQRLSEFASSLRRALEGQGIEIQTAFQQIDAVYQALDTYRAGGTESVAELSAPLTHEAPALADASIDIVAPTAIETLESVVEAPSVDNTEVPEAAQHIEKRFAPDAEAGTAAGDGKGLSTEDADLQQIFAEEAAGQFQALIRELAGLKRGQKSSLLAVRQILHTLSGSAHMAGHPAIGERSGQLLSDLQPCTASTDDLIRASNRLETALPDLMRRSAIIELGEIAAAPADRLFEQNGAALKASAESPALVLPAEFASRPTAFALGGEEVDAELAEIFAAEAAEILEELDAALTQWQSGNKAQESARRMQRSLHTLKGGARILGFAQLGDLAHEMESRVEQFTARSKPLTGSEFEELRVRVIELERQHDALMRGHYSALLKAVEPQAESQKTAPPEPASAAAIELKTDHASAEKIATPTTVVPSEPLVPVPSAPPLLTQAWRAELFTEDGEESASTAPRELARVGVEVLDNLLKQAGEVSIVRARVEQQNNLLNNQLAEMSRTVARLRDQLRQMEQETEAQIAARGINTGAATAEGDFDPLELDRYTRMQELSRGLSESVSDLSALHGSLDELSDETGTLLRQQGRINTLIQQGLMESLMVPFARQTPRFERLLRQVAEEEGKKVRLQVEGGRAELDRNVLERITPAMEHLLRNAVVHGIEAPEARLAAGKSPEGAVTISVTREGAQLLLEVVDDGRGLNYAAIRATAIKRGLLLPELQLPDDELARFIFRHGFSTVASDHLSQNAGRGVGMDVVSAEIKQLGGTLELRSRPGEGTRLAILLPLSLALSRAVMVRQGDETFALPIAAIEGIVRLPQSFAELGPEDDSGQYQYAGRQYAVRFLADLVQLPRAPLSARSLAGVLVKQSATVDGQERRTVLVVDQILGNQEIVSRPVGRLVSALRGIAGATILPGGEVVLILEVSTLLQQRFDRSAEHKAGQAAVRAAHDAAQALSSIQSDAMRVLVVDDSVTIRRVAERLLTRQGYLVSTAKDGLDAISILQTASPSAILLDIEMPRADGFEVASFVRNSERIASTPIIMITSRSGDKHRARAQQLGVNRYLIKPWQEDKLLAELRAVIAEHELVTP